ncbi:MAG: hypothetical protein PHX40_04595 [Bacilli bacterium]|nr:hypothetical protein [Bacilli bacterium]
MKTFKKMILILIVSFMFAGFGAKALEWTKSYLDIRIPAFRGIWKDGDYTKINTGFQYLYVLDAKNLSMTESRSIEARTSHKIAPIGATAWKKAIIEGTINWGTNNSSPGLYELQIRTVDNHITATRVWGSWTW